MKELDNTINPWPKWSIGDTYVTEGFSGKISKIEWPWVTVEFNGGLNQPDAKRTILIMLYNWETDTFQHISWTRI